MEKCGNPGGPAKPFRVTLAACSGCAGNYEDPDRTAWADNQIDEPSDEPSNDDDHVGALRLESKTTIERNSNGTKAIDEIAGRRNENENENHRDA